MSELLLAIEGLDKLHPLLPTVVTYALLALASLVLIIPFSSFCWLISASLSAQYNNFIEILNSFANFFKSLSDKNTKIKTRLISSFYSKYNVIVNLDDSSYKSLDHPAHNVLNDFEKVVRGGEQLANDRQAEKTKLISDLNNNVEILSQVSNSIDNQKIPQLELNKHIERDKKQAAKDLMLFVPLLLAVIIVNTFLLDKFFDALLEESIKILGFKISLSIIIALFFTLIEVGIGMFFGRASIGIDINKKHSDEELLKVFGWIIVSALALIESYLYLLVGMSMISDLGPDELPDLIEETGTFLETFSTIIIGGGWLALFGPAIVLGLFIFGHRFCVAFYNYNMHTDYERFKKELDERYEMHKKMQINADMHSSSIKTLADSIKQEDINLEINEGEYFDNIKQIPENLEDKINEMKNLISEIEETELPIPEIQVAHLSEAENEAYHKKNVIYLIALIVSFFVLKELIPESYGRFDYLYSIMFLSVSCVSGILITTKAKVFQTAGGDIARVVMEPLSDKTVFIWIVLLILLLSSLYLMLDPVWAAASRGMSGNGKFILALLCVAVGFTVGKNILHAINSWVLMLQVSLAYLKSLFFLLVTTIIRIIEQIIKLCFGIITSFGAPSKLILGKIL